MTTPSLTVPSSSRAVRPQWRRAAARMLRTSLVQAAWFWVICLTVVALAVGVLARAGRLEMSIVQFLRYGGIWYPFSLFVVVTATYLTLHVASGMTRRSFVRASLLAVVVTGLLYGIVMTAAVLAEGAVYAANGWAPSDDAVPPALEGLLPMLSAYALSFTSGGLSGLLVGLAYYRFGALRGTLSLPLTLVPILAVMTLTDVGLAAELDRVAPLQTLASVAILAAGAVAFHLLARRAPITAPLVTS